jgi:hypothetical protein
MKTKLLALILGLICHLSFGAAVVVMMVGLFGSMDVSGIVRPSAGALLVDLALLLQFPVLHTTLLMVGRLSRQGARVPLPPTARALQGMQTPRILCDGVSVVYRSRVEPRSRHYCYGVHRVRYRGTKGEGTEAPCNIRGGVPRAPVSTPVLPDALLVLECGKKHAQ